MTLTFSEASHAYRLDGKRIKGVTSLIGAGLPKPALVKWAGNFVADHVIDNFGDVQDSYAHNREALRYELRGLPSQKRDTAGARGSEIHEVAQEIIHGREVQVPDRLLPYVTGYVKFLDEFGVQPIITEVSVASRQHWYAGRIDCVATIGALGGVVSALDWKTSTNVYGATALQVSAYSNAEFYVTDEDPDHEIVMPQVERTHVVHITEQGTFLHDLGRYREEVDEAFTDFLAVKAVADRIGRIDGVWNAKQRRRIGSYLGEPIELSKAAS